MKGQISGIMWTVVLMILACNLHVDAAKAARRGGNKKTPNYDHVALSYGGKTTNHQPVQQHHVPKTQSYAPSAPALPVNNHQPVQQHQVHQTKSHAPSATVNNNNQPIGWNVPHSNAEAQQKSVTNTQSALPYPQNTGFNAHSSGAAPPPYTPNAGFNAHSSNVAPPPYTPNAGFNSHSPAGPPPPYSQNPSSGYQPGPAYPVHNAPNAAYPQQTHYNPSPVAPNYAPNGQPVINNYYGQPQSSGGSGGGFVQTAVAAGVGSLAGSALYGALKPSSEEKTIIIHEHNNAPASPQPAATGSPAESTSAAAASPAMPASVPASVPAPVPTVDSTVNPSSPAATSPVSQPQTDIGARSSVSSDGVPLAPTVPLAPLPDPSPNPSVAVPLALIPDVSTTVQTAATSSGMNAAQNETTPTTSASTSVPLAPFPSDPSSQAQKGSSATTFAMFNITVYTIISIVVASF